MRIFGRLRRQCPSATPPDAGAIPATANQRLLVQVNMTAREQIARATGTMVQYYGDEVRAVQEACIGSERMLSFLNSARRRPTIWSRVIAGEGSSS